MTKIQTVCINEFKKHYDNLVNSANGNPINLAKFLEPSIEQEKLAYQYCLANGKCCLLVPDHAEYGCPNVYIVWAALPTITKLIEEVIECLELIPEVPDPLQVVTNGYKMYEELVEALICVHCAMQSVNGCKYAIETYADDPTSINFGFKMDMEFARTCWLSFNEANERFEAMSELAAQNKDIVWLGCNDSKLIWIKGFTDANKDLPSWLTIEMAATKSPNVYDPSLN